VSNFRNRVRRKRTLQHKEASNLDGPFSRFSNETYLGSRVLRASAGATDPALQLPTDIAGLWAWYDVGDLSTVWQDEAGTTPVTSLDNPINRIDDKGPNGYDVRNSGNGSTIKYKPSGFNGVGAADFVKSTESYLRDLDGPNITVPPLTIIAAIRSRHVASSYGYLVVLDGTTTIRVPWEPDIFGGTGPGYHDGTHDSLGVGSEKTEAEVFSLVYQPDLKAKYYENVTEISTPGGITFAGYTAGYFWFSTATAASGYDGVIREMAIFTTEVSQADREYVVAGMRARANLITQTNPHPQFSGVDSWRWSAKTLSVADAASVFSWTDTQNRVSLTNDITPPTYRADYSSSGYPAVEFNGTDTWLSNDLHPNAGQTSTIFIVMRGAVAGGKDYLLDGASSANRHAIRRDATTDVLEIWADSFVKSGAVATPNIITGKFNTTASELFEDRTSVATGDVGLKSLLGVVIGAAYDKSNDGGAGGWHEVLIYDSALSTAQIAEVWDYIESEWGFSF
jgi:hypothetical protein